jgi:quercetin dioxygenase-like cupin family protein
MSHRIKFAVAIVSIMATSAIAQTAMHSLPPEQFKFMPANEVIALTDKPGPGAKTAFPSDHENYFVEYAARTDVGNVVEVHTHWSHYIHILAGEGTLTYGGTVSNAKETGPGQVRGDAIVGGSSVKVHEGDYIQIPAGMPHLFTVPQGTKLRYVVFNTRE